MNDLFYYLFQVGLGFTILYLFYRFLCNGLTFHRANRILLLSLLPLSVMIPFLNISFFANPIFQDTTLPVFYEDFAFADHEIPADFIPSERKWDFMESLVFCYALGVLIALIRTVLNLFKIISIKRKSATCFLAGNKVYLADTPLVFSCFHWIFIPRNKREEVDPSVVEHEKYHGKARHTFDLALTELFVAFQWFNPFVYLFRKDLKTLHEYQVDSMILQTDLKKSDYLQLMLNNLISSNKELDLCNYFNGLTIQKRVKMITKENSSKWKLISYFFLLPLLAVMTMSFSASENTENQIPSISPIKPGDYKRISSTYGMRMHPLKKVMKFHHGIDFSAKKGTKIVATADGVVTTREFKKGSYGKIVIVKHGGGYETWYTQMSEYAVKKGDHVKRGDLVGYVGSSGMSTGPHLHYEVRKDGKSVNPQDYMKK